MSELSEEHYVFQGEMMLLSWKETHSGGAQVTLLLADSEDLEKFKSMTVKSRGCAGQRLMTVMVQVGDGEAPVAQTPAPPKASQPKGGALAVLSGQWCQMARFQEWLQARNHATWRAAFIKLTEAGDSTLPSEIAGEVVRQLCGVDSRAMLDHSQEAAALFHKYIRLPFAALMDAER